MPGTDIWKDSFSKKRIRGKLGKTQNLERHIYLLNNRNKNLAYTNQLLSLYDSVIWMAPHFIITQICLEYISIFNVYIIIIIIR